MFATVFRVSVLGAALVLLTAGAGADDKKDEKPVELNVGDGAPTFQLTDDGDKTWSSSDHFGKKWVVVYFYPGDFTPGCTAQAKAFTASMEKLREKGVEVVGVSGDSVRTHELFKKAHNLNFTLLADEDGAGAKQFGVPFGRGATVKARDALGKVFEIDGKPYEFERKGTAARWTFVIGKDGKIAYKNTKVVPADDAKKITEFITKAQDK
jgi:peroxiredoxin Q/BCP